MYETSVRYKEVVAGSHRAVVRVQLLNTVQFGAAPTGGTVLPVLDGDIKMSSTSDVKATLDITVPGDYWDDVQPYGTELFAERGVDFGDGTSEYVPLGYFRIEDVDQDMAPYGPVQISAKDRIAHMIDSRLVYPYQYAAGTTHRQLAERLINQTPTPPLDSPERKGYGMYECQFIEVPIFFDAYDGDRSTLPAGVVEDSIYEHLAKIFDSKGCIMRFDRLGQLRVVLRDAAPGTPSVYTVTPGRTGNLIKASRQVRRGGVYNMIVARGSDPAAPTGTRLAYNNDTTSPLYWAGPFGVVPRYYASPLLKTSAAADDAAVKLLGRYRGLPSGLAVATVPDPSLDPLDPITIVIGAESQTHIIDEVTIPLVGSSAVEIETRALNEVPNEDTSDPGTGTGGNPDPADGTGGDSGGTPQTVTPLVHAAEAILGRLLSGDLVLEDWSWVGAPAVVLENNDALMALFQAAHPGADTVGAIAKDWLAAYITAGGGTLPTGTGTPAPAGNNMAAILRIGPTPGFNHVKLGVGYAPADTPGKHVDYAQSDIAGGLTIPKYAEVLTPGRVRLSVPLDGVTTTKNTKYPRVEFREVAQDGTSLAAWDSSKAGRHYIKGKSRVVRLPPKKPHVVLAQIHDASDDVATWRVEKPNLYARYSDSENVGTTTLALDTDYEWMIEVVNASGGSTCQINYYWGTTLPVSPNYTKSAPAGTGWYFKAGNYAQSNKDLDAVADGPVIVEMSDLEIWHTGYPAPADAPVGTGGGGGDTGGGSGSGGSTPGTSPVPSSAVSIFSSDFADFSGWSTVQNKNGSSTTGYPLSIVNAGSGHENAARFEVRSGDTAISGERSEIRFPSSCNVSSGQTRWIEFDLRFEPGFQGVGTSGWLIVMQNHPDDSTGGSPQWDLTVREDETLRLRLHETAYHTIGPIDAGVWHRYTVKSTFSTSSGSHEVWRDGTKVLGPVSDKSLKSSSGNYFKLGIYRNSNSFTSILQYDRVRMWSG